MLNAHNEKRALHEDTPPLSWASTLVEDAKSWAVHLADNDILAHNPNLNSVKIGENIYSLDLGRPAWGKLAKQPSDQTITDTASKAINMFYNEEKLYNKEDYNLGTMGHFTQLVWRNTTKLGCAWGWNPYYNKIIIVCRYDPIGNWNTGTAGVLSQNVKNLKEGFTSHIQADNFKNYAAWPWK